MRPPGYKFGSSWRSLASSRTASICRVGSASLWLWGQSDGVAPSWVPLPQSLDQQKAGGLWWARPVLVS